jgi:penicillin-binding protein 1B
MVRTRHPLRKLLLAAATLVAALLLYLDARITGTFEARRYELPARVYARPLELFPGAPLTGAALAAELDLLGYRRVQRIRGPGDYGVAGNRVELFSRGFDFPDAREDGRRVVLTFADAQLATLESAGASLDLLRLEPLLIGGIYPAHGEDRLLLRLDDVPETLVGALLAIEDRGFYSHHGFSPSGIARAALQTCAPPPWSPAAVRSRSSWSRTTT